MTVPLPSDPRGPQPERLRADVDAAMAGLEGLDARPLTEHVEAFERVHAALGAVLAQGAA